ncbi:MAG: hypothetical protein ACKVKL_14540 [Pseudomonadales bacterium]
MNRTKTASRKKVVDYGQIGINIRGRRTTISDVQFGAVIPKQSNFLW